MAWLPVHLTLRAHPKMLRFSRSLNVSRATAVGHLVLLWTWAIDYASDGDIGRWDADEIAAGAEWDGEPGAFYAALREAGFVDEDGSIHDWGEYGGRIADRRAANAERMREARAAHVQRTSGARTTHVQRTTEARASHVHTRAALEERSSNTPVLPVSPELPAGTLPDTPEILTSFSVTEVPTGGTPDLEVLPAGAWGPERGSGGEPSADRIAETAESGGAGAPSTAGAVPARARAARKSQSTTTDSAVTSEPVPVAPVAPVAVSATTTRVGRILDALKERGIHPVALSGRDTAAVKASTGSPELIAEAFAAAFSGQWGDDWMRRNLSLAVVIDRLPGYQSWRSNGSSVYTDAEKYRRGIKHV